MDGSPVRILAFKIPKDPTKDRWVPEVIDESLHVVHNFWALDPANSFRSPGLLTASYEGLGVMSNLHKGKWKWILKNEGNQENSKSNRGASEVKFGRTNGFGPFIPTIEPWHGHQAVVYPSTKPGMPSSRTVIDSDLKWGHAVWCADLDGDKQDE